jgi:hypothetical protein
MKNRMMKFYIDMRERCGGMENEKMKFVTNGIDRWEVC